MKVRFWLVTEDDDLHETVVTLPENCKKEKIEEELVWWSKETFGNGNYEVGWEKTI